MATVGRRGRFQVAEPLFERATPVQLDGRRANEGDLVLLGYGKRGRAGGADASGART